MHRIVCALVLLAAACSTTEEKKPPQPACPDLSITVERAELTPLSNAIAIQERKAGGYMVQLYDHDGVNCKQALSGHRVPRPHEVFARAYVGPTAHQTAVGLGDDTEMDVGAVLSRGPDRVGDPVVICLRQPVSFDGTAGTWAGKRITMSGRFAGTFCGMQH